MNNNTHRSFVGTKWCALIAGLLLAGQAAQAGPTNDWASWRFKRAAFVFTNSPLYVLNGHSVGSFSEDLFDDATRLYLYNEADGKVFGVGTITLQTSNREAVFNLEAKGTLSTKGSTPNLSFTIAGDGVGSVDGKAGEAELNARFTQTRIITNGIHPFFEYFSEGTIRGSVKQEGAKELKFSDTLTIRLDPVALHSSAHLIADLVDVKGRRLVGHSHGTNNAFGRYEGESVEMSVKGTYNPKTGTLSLNGRGLGHSAPIKVEVDGKLQSANPGEHIHISDVMLRGKAYGQRLEWPGIGLAVPANP